MKAYTITVQATSFAFNLSILAVGLDVLPNEPATLNDPLVAA